ncbi:Pilus (MSHA type) biogenesis protein MshL [Candidatus Electrothrix laxa]
MKSNTRLLHSVLAVTTTALLLCSCVGKKSEEESKQTARLAAPEKKQRTVIEPSLLPQRFQRAGYIINDDEANAMLDSDASDDFQLKVGADITTHEPITLREAMKALIRNKKMSLSWASDVNQDLRVDVDVTADDNFYEAIDNILRQLDYFHEVQGSTLIIKYRESKQYQIAMPFVKQDYNTSVGGNSFGSDISIDSKGNTFDIWENIQNNIDSLISTWSAVITNPEENKGGKGDVDKDEEEEEKPAEQVSRRVSSTDSSYTIDKPIGLITVHAPKSLQKRIADYLETLERELYKQIIIEAKIVEVQLENNSSLGINWQTLLQNLTFAGGSAYAENYYGKETSELNENGTSFSDISENINSTSNSTTNSNSSGSDDFGSLTSDFSDSSSSSSGTDSTTSGTTDSTGSTTGSTSDSSLLTDSVSTLSSLTNTLTSGTSAASTVATLITGGAASAAIAGINLTAFSFDKFINALKQQGKTSVLSNPKISVMNGQPALITVGREVTFINSIESSTSDTKTTFTINTEQLLSGIGLALSAVIRNDDEIIMNLVPITSELLEPIEYVTVGEGKVGLPIVNKREMSTTVKVKNGSMLVVGGLISETEASDGDFLFGTENIPYLKYLFGYEEKQKSKRELIILLRPRII